MDIDKLIEDLTEVLRTIEMPERLKYINRAKEKLQKAGSFTSEPVDCVQWVPIEDIEANDYNPNKVAPPEMELLYHSIKENGYTQPVVVWKKEGGRYEVIDGFHRNLIVRKYDDINERVQGYLPIVVINKKNAQRGDRIAATIRHNRARGKHQVENMSDIVIELTKRNWSEKRIGKELGMEPDEVLRLKQVKGLAEVFKDREFSEAWEHSGEVEESMVDDMDAEETNLEWMNDMDVVKYSTGWTDRSEQSSIYCNKKGHVLGLTQKSRFNDEWFWYTYGKPVKEGRAATKKHAKEIIIAEMGKQHVVIDWAHLHI